MIRLVVIARRPRALQIIELGFDEDNRING